MSLRQFVVAALALLSGTSAATSCCFVVQDEAQGVYWSEYATETYISSVILTSVTTLLTPYPTTTITNYETNFYPIEKVFSTTFLVTENPVSLYTNAAGNAIVQRTEILAGPEPTVTGGVTVNSPTGFWVYTTAKIYAAPAVTDANGKVACGTISSFSNVAPSAAACVATFTGINADAAASFDSIAATAVQISLTTPFIHIPTRAGLEISPSEACVQGNGTENYGYPVQQLIDFLAGNAYYSSQFPGIKDCLPAGPTIQPVQNLLVAVADGPLSATVAADPPEDPPATSAATSGSNSTACGLNCGGTESATGTGLLQSTVTTVTPTGTAPPSSSSTPSSSVPPSTSTTTASGPSALSDNRSASTSTGPESVATCGLLGCTTTSTPPSTSSSSSFSSSIVSPVLETTPASSSSSASSAIASSLSSVPNSIPASSILSLSSSSTSTKLSISSSSQATSLISSALGITSVSSRSAGASKTSSISIIVPLPETVASPTFSGIPISSNIVSSFLSSLTSSLKLAPTALPSTIALILPGSILLPVGGVLPGLTGPVTLLSSSSFVMEKGPTTIPLVIGASTTEILTGSGTGLAPVTFSGAGRRLESGWSWGKLGLGVGVALFLGAGG